MPKCRLCKTNETQKIKCMGGIFRKYDPNSYCKECYAKITKEFSKS